MLAGWAKTLASFKSAAATIWERRSRAASLGLGLGPVRGGVRVFVLGATMAVSDEWARSLVK